MNGTPDRPSLAIMPALSAAPSWWWCVWMPSRPSWWCSRPWMVSLSTSPVAASSQYTTQNASRMLYSNVGKVSAVV